MEKQTSCYVLYLLQWLPSVVNRQTQPLTANTLFPQIIGVEPAKIPSMALALAGDISMQPPVTTVADGINVSE